MSADDLFFWSTRLALVGWMTLIVLPRWRWSAGLIAAAVIPLLLAALYAFLVVKYLVGAGGGFGSLEQIAALFQNPYVMLAGWIHYLAFDLFIGSWEVRDSRSLGIPHLAIIPCLLLTLMFGPAGLLAYLVMRGALKRRWSLEGA